MITRHKSKLLKSEQSLKADTMNSESNDITDSSSTNEGGFEINNQLGEPGIFDAITNDNTVIEPLRAGDTNSLTNPAEPVTEMQQLMAMITQLAENQKQQTQQQEIHHQRVVADICQLKAETKEIVNQLRAETKELINDEVKVVKKTLESNIKEVKTLVNKGDKELGGKVDKVSKRVDEISKEWDERLNTHCTEVSREIKAVSEENGNRLTQLDQQINELQESQKELRTKSRHGGERPATRSHPDEATRHITFNGASRFPIEFLKELDEIQREYYEESNIKWIAQHLEGDAFVWWRIVKDSITTYKEFQDAFREKFWSDLVQQEVRDNLEYGRFYQSDGLTPIQYIERRVLECRQLNPPISDAHLIKKLIRHYSKEIEIASITRGIKDLAAFESLLKEFMASRCDESRTLNRTAVKGEGSFYHSGEPTPRNNKEKIKSSWREGRQTDSGVDINHHKSTPKIQKTNYVTEPVASTSKVPHSDENDRLRSKN